VIAVLVSSTRRNSLDTALSSNLMNHEIKVYFDDERKGANFGREHLLVEILKDSRFTHFRVLDDDDELLSSFPMIENADVIYSPGLLNGKLTKFSFDPYAQLFHGSFPWAMLTTTDYARKYIEEYGFFFDPFLPCVQGSHLFLSLLKRGARMVGSATPVYKYSGHNGLSKGPFFVQKYQEYKKEALAFYAQHKRGN
jgi:hypothetical protein